MKTFSDFLDSVIECVWLVLIVMVPLVFSSSFQLAFELPKVLLFRGGVLLMLLAFFLKLIARQRIECVRNFRTSPLILFISLFVGVLGLATLFSPTPWASFWGSYERHQGFLSFLYYFVFFGLVLVHLNKKRVTRIFAAVALSGLLVGGYGVLQKFGVDPLFQSWPTAAFLGRVFSTTGQPNFLAQLILLMIPLTAGAAIFMKKNTFFMASTLVMLAALVFTLSRGAILGLVGGLFVAVWLLSLYYKEQALRWVSFSVAAFLIGTIVATNIFASQGFIKNNTVLSRLTLSGENVRSVASRMVIWPGALRMIGERPLLGHGLDTFNLVYPRYLDPAIFDFENLSSAPDRAHNELLDLAVAAGLLGLVFYLLLLGLLTRMVMNYITEQPRAGDLLLVLGPFLGIASLFFANQFSFSVTLMWFFFWLHLALLAFLLSPKQRHTIHLTSLYHMMVRMGVFTIVIIGIGALGYSTIVTPALAEVGFRNGRVAHNAEQTASAFAHYHEAVDRAPYQRQYYYWLAEAALAQNNQDMLAEAMRLIQDLPRIAGEHFDVLLYRARLLSSLDGPPVLDAFDDVIAHSPNNPRTYLYAGHAYFEAARHQEAIDMYIAYLRLVPDLWRWKTHLEERLPEEREKYRIFYKLNPDFDEVFERLSYAYGQIGDSEKAAFYQYYSN